MKKIIDIDDYCTHVIKTHSNDNVGHIELSIIHVCDLPNYTEPLTADGLTLKEFAFKAKGNMSNVQRFDRESMNWKDCNDNLPRVVLDMVSIPEIMEIYRIKPEVVHYITKSIYVASCGKRLAENGNYSNLASEVTCPDCIEAMNKTQTISVNSEIERINNLNLLIVSKVQ